jgi:CBS domain
VLLRDSPDSKVATGTFDYNDLNAYLLLVVGLAQPDEDQISRFKELAQKGREGQEIPMKDVKDLGRKEPLIFLGQSESLTKAVEIFGSGIHRIVIVEERSSEVVGVLTQLRLVEFFWENRAHFSPIEPLFHKTLRDLDLGSHSVFAIK